MDVEGVDGVEEEVADGVAVVVGGDEVVDDDDEVLENGVVDGI